MKLLLLLIAVAAVALGAWQRQTLVELRGETARVAAELQVADARLDSPTKSEPASKRPDAPAVSDSELTELMTSYFAVKDGFYLDLGNRMSGTSATSHPEICEPLSRLTTAQIHAVIDAWPAQPAPGEKRVPDMRMFLQLAGRVNPAATVPLLYELLQEAKGIRLDDWVAENAFQNWFRHDPEGLLQWAQQAGMPDGFKGQCATWADAALTVRDPSVENVQKLLGHETVIRFPSPEVALKLQTPEARLRFFQSLHGATGGIYDKLGQVVTVLADRTPFAQLAYLADAAPAFQSSKAEASNPGGFSGLPQNQLGSLRLEVAARSRDGTAAQRWEWLTRRPEDHPSEKLFGRLIDAWCNNDYADTAAWLRSLPPGSDRDMATKQMIAFLQQAHDSEHLSEWK